MHLSGCEAGCLLHAAPYEMRLKQGMPLDEVLMHAGDVHGHEKIDSFKRLNLWAADRWDPAAGQQLIHQVHLS